MEYVKTKILVIEKYYTSLGPCALDPGPRIPVTINYEVGYIDYKSPIKGIDPPSNTHKGFFPKNSIDAFST